MTATSTNSRIAAIPFAAFRYFPAGGGGVTVTEGDQLMGPLGLTLAPNGDLLTVNGGNGDGVEITRTGSSSPLCSSTPPTAAATSSD